MNLPNILSIFRILVVFPLILLLDVNPYIASALFLAAIFTDYLDGKIARNYNKVSDMGKLLDPLADKILVLSILVFYVSKNEISFWIVILILLREFAITGLRSILAQKGIVLPALKSGKIKTFFQDFAILFYMWNLPYKEFLLIMALILTLSSGGFYFYRYGKEIF